MKKIIIITLFSCNCIVAIAQELSFTTLLNCFKNKSDKYIKTQMKKYKFNFIKYSYSKTQWVAIEEKIWGYNCKSEKDSTVSYFSYLFIGEGKSSVFLGTTYQFKNSNYFEKIKQEMLALNFTKVATTNSEGLENYSDGKYIVEIAAKSIENVHKTPMYRVAIYALKPESRQ